jgi:hypothetical protein
MNVILNNPDTTMNVSPDNPDTTKTHREHRVALARMGVKLVHAHSYLYYVLAKAVLCDATYDLIKENVEGILLDLGIFNDVPTMIFNPFSSENYADEEKDIAMRLSSIEQNKQLAARLGLNNC